MKPRTAIMLFQPGVLAALALAACRQEPGDVARPPNGSASGESATTSEAPIHETAREYLERHGRGSPASSQSAPPEGAGSIAACVMCHGSAGEGKPALGTPRIGALPEWYIVRQLKYFKQGVRATTDDDAHGTLMRAVSLLVGPEPAMEDAAAHIAALQPPPSEPATTGDAERGAELYAGCAGCHGQDGRGGVDSNTPSIVEQNGDYLIRQIENYRLGLRGAHPLDVFGREMQTMTAETLMSPEDTIDVATYIGTLRERGEAAAAR